MPKKSKQPKGICIQEGEEVKYLIHEENVVFKKKKKKFHNLET